MAWYNKFRIKNILRKTQEVTTATEATGNCFEVAANYVVENSILRGNKNLILVHGEVIGQGPISGVKHWHAWVEDGDIAIDLSNGKDITISKSLYYAIGKISNTKQYNPDQTRKLLLKYKHFGPWK
jgi:hypothetical protein